MSHHLNSLLLLLLSFPLASSQVQTTTECKDRTVLVNALDAHGVPIENLVGHDFKVSYHGRPVPVVWSQHRKYPGGRIVVLVDTSGSMKGDFEGGSAKWKIAHAAAVEFISSANSQAQVSLMGFASEINTRFDSSGGRQPIEDWLNRPATREGKELKGSTALYRTILETLKNLGPTNPGDAIYVITDGGDNAHKETISQVERSLQGVRLFAFLLNSPLTQEARSGTKDLYELTLKSGGFLVSISPGVGGYGLEDHTIASIRTSTRMLQAQMASFYVLGIQPPDNISEGDHWKVDVVDIGGRSRKDITVAYPQTLASSGCVAQSAQR